MRLGALAPGHGDLIRDPLAKLDEYIGHRLLREQIVAGALAERGPATTADLLGAVYADIDGPEERFEMARHSLWAHLRKLETEGRATASDRDDPDAMWTSR